MSALKIEQNFCANVLHGPVTFYDETGNILGRDWYVLGVRQGKRCLNYHDGSRYSVQRFREGVWDGRQEFYYPNGEPRTLMHYTKGKLNGEVLLYYPNNQLKRELNFVDGKREGVERMWDFLGNLNMEVHYKGGHSVGLARTWHPNGKLAKEIQYAEDGHAIKIQSWDSNGILLSDPKPDYFDWITSQTQLLTRSLSDVFRELQLVAPLLPQSALNKEALSFQENVQSFEDKIVNLEALGKSLLKESGLDESSHIEPIWKSPEAYRDMQKQLDETVKLLKSDIDNINSLMLEAKKRLKERQDAIIKEIKEKKNSE